VESFPGLERDAVGDDVELEADGGDDVDVLLLKICCLKLGFTSNKFGLWKVFELNKLLYYEKDLIMIFRPMQVRQYQFA